MVSASLRVGRTRLTVSPCLSLSDASRARSPNSEWWKFASANQRSTRAGTARDSSAARSAATSVSAFCASCSNVWRPMGSRVLTTITVGRARWAIASGSAPNSDPPGSPGGADAPITTRSAWSASRRIAVRTLAVSRRSGSDLAVTNWRANAARACSAWARTASVTPAGTRCMTTTVASWRTASASASRSASSACGPPRTGTRIRRIWRAPRCLTTAMSHGRLAHDLVDGRADDRAAAGITARAGLAAPAEDHQVGLLLRRRLDDPGRRVPADPDERVDDRALGHVVQDLLEEAPRLPGPGRALGQRHALGHLDDAQRRQLAGSRLHQRRADADQLLRGQRVGDRDQDPRGQRLRGHAPASAAPAARQRSTR